MHLHRQAGRNVDCARSPAPFERLEESGASAGGDGRRPMSAPAVDLIVPYGGRLVDLVVGDEEEGKELVARAPSMRSLQLSPRSRCDLELLATGAFSPVDRLTGEAGHKPVVREMRLVDGTLFPIPITLLVPDDLAVGADVELALRNAQNELLAVMTVEEKFPWDREGEEARQV